jgi:exodeoxyribonuclease V alpha subunit
LTESIRSSKQSRVYPLQAPPDILARIPETAQTLHRLLGIRPLRAQPRHHAGNPLAVDVMVVDEASMVDLPLMARLLAALPDQARLIILGDKDQLSSVEAGKVLGDLCNAGSHYAYSPAFRARLEAVTNEHLGDAGEIPDSALNDCVVMLRHSHRFTGAIGDLATAVNGGETATALSILRAADAKNVSWQALTAHGLEADLMDYATDAYRPYLQAAHRGDAEEALARLDRYRVLCALREGPAGVVAINAIIERALRRAELIEAREIWYAGRPVMVTRNDYALRLFNGDIGVIMPDSGAGGRLRAFFSPSGQDTVGGGLRSVAPSRLPAHETVYAMTVHKSQGSEFEHLDLVLADRVSPVLTRELVYTGITRAREALRLWGHEAVFRETLARTVVRSSGLRQVLWGQQAGSPSDGSPR